MRPTIYLFIYLFIYLLLLCVYKEYNVYVSIECKLLKAIC